MKRLLSFLFLLFILFNVQAATITWTGATNSNWNEATNWSPNQIPTDSDDVIVTATFPDLIIPSGYLANASSFEMSGGNLIIEGSTSIGFNSIAPSGYDFRVSGAFITINASAQVFIYGGLTATNNSIITNNGIVLVWGNEVGSPINYFLDTGAELHNNSTAKWYSRENKNGPTRKEAFMILDNGAKVYNSGDLYNHYSSSLEDYVEKGIVLKNAAELYNTSRFIALWVQEAGVELIGGGPSKTIFENQAALRIRETPVNTDNTSVAIKTGTNTRFTNSLGGSILMAFSSSPSLPGFLNTTPQIDAQGCFSYQIAPPTIFNPGSLTLASTSILNGTGYLNNSNITFNGATVSPGNSPGIIEFTNNYSGNAIFEMELAGTNGPGVPQGHDQIVFQGSTNDLSSSTMDVVLIDGFVPQIGDAFVLVLGPYTGTLNSLNLPGQPGIWTVDYLPSEVKITLAHAINVNYNQNNVGVGLDTPKTKLHVKDGDVYLETIGSGVIMKDANGNCYRITVSVAGILNTELLTSCL